MKEKKEKSKEWSAKITCLTQIVGTPVCKMAAGAYSGHMLVHVCTYT